MRQFSNDQAWAHRANQRVNHARKNTERRSGWRPAYWFQPDPGEWVRFFPGDYGGQPIQINYQVWVPNPHTALAERKRKAGRNPGMDIPCNCNSGTLDVPCVPCSLIAEQRKAGQKPDFFVGIGVAINLLVLKTYHKVKVKSDDGSREFTRYEKCTAELGKCTFCKEGWETFFGNTTYVNAKNKEWNALMGFQRQIAHKCRSCEHGVVVPVACRCPDCGREAEFPVGHLMKMEAEKGYCDACGFNGDFQFAKDCQIFHRETGDYTQGCGNPTALGLFDVNMRVLKRVTSEKKGADGKMKRQYQLEMPEWDEQQLAEEVMKKTKYPMDFNFLMRMEASQQAEILGVPNPFRGLATEGLPEVHAGAQPGQGFQPGTGVPASAGGPPMADAPIPAAAPQQPAPSAPASQPMRPPSNGAAPLPGAPTAGRSNAPDPDPAPQDAPAQQGDDEDDWGF